MRRERRARLITALTVVLGVGLGCREAAAPSPWKVQLMSGWADEGVEGEDWFYFDAARAPRWRVEPSPDGDAWLHLEPVDGRPEERVRATIEPRGAFGIVRTATRAAIGRYRARLSLDEEPIWQGSMHFMRRPEARPQIVRAVERWSTHPRSGEAEFERLTAAAEPMLRFSAYLLWGRRARTRSSTEAESIWSRGSADPVLRERVPDAAKYLASSAAFMLVDSGQLDAAEKAVQGFEAWDGERGRDHVAAAHYIRGRIAWHRGQPAQTLRWFRSSMEHSWAAGDDNTWSVTASLLSGQLLRLGRFRESARLARDAAARARRTRTRINARGDELWTRLWGQAAGVFAPDPHGLAREYESILEDFERLEWRSNVAVTRAVLAYLALRRDDVAAAERWIRPVFGIPSKELGIERWFIRLVESEVLLERGALDAAQAELHAIRTGARAEVGRVGADEVVALRLLAEVARRQGKPELVRERLDTAWRASLDAARQIDLVGARNNYLHLQRELPVALARTHVDEGDLLGAIAVLEETLYERWAQLRAFDSIESHPEAWSKLETARGEARAADSANCEAGHAAARVSCRKRKTDTQVAVRAAKMALLDEIEVPRRSHHRADVARVQAALQDRQAVLVSLDGDDRRSTLLMTRDRVHVAGDAGLLDGLEGPLSELESVAVVGTLDLQGALDAAGTPWAARLETSRWPSLVWQGRGVRPAAGVAAILSDPNGSSPKTRAASARLAETLGAQLFVGPDATRERLTALLTERRPFVVFSGHAEVLDYDHSSTRIWLFDSKLDMQDVLRDHLGADVVVLNGCTTGGTARGYGVGLPEAFLLQGTRAVLATIEPVPDDASMRFVERFAAAEPTKDPAAAFRAAVVASVEAKDDVWRRYRLWAR